MSCSVGTALTAADLSSRHQRDVYGVVHAVPRVSAAPAEKDTEGEATGEQPPGSSQNSGRTRMLCRQATRKGGTVCQVLTWGGPPPPMARRHPREQTCIDASARHSPGGATAADGAAGHAVEHDVIQHAVQARRRLHVARCVVRRRPTQKQKTMREQKLAAHECKPEKPLTEAQLRCCPSPSVIRHLEQCTSQVATHPKRFVTLQHSAIVAP